MDGVSDGDDDDIDAVAIVTDDDTGDDDAEDELEKSSLSFESTPGAEAALKLSSFVEAKLSARIGLALARRSLPEVSVAPSVDDDSFGQLTESCRVVESG